MKISVSDDVAYNFVPVEVSSRDRLVELTSSKNWSSGVYKDGHRNLKNFLYADTIALDIDGGCSITDAKDKFTPYKNVILTSRNHGKAKNGIVADRFRVILPLERRVTSAEEYKRVWKELNTKFPFIDPACSDASRFWYPNSQLPFSENWASGAGVSIPPVSEDRKVEIVPTTTLVKGGLNRRTIDFILNGKSNNWNATLYEAALDFRSQGYSQDEAEFYLRVAARKDLGNQGGLDDKDLKTINSAYSADTVGHSMRGAASAFEFQRVGDAIKNNRQVQWIVENFMSVGGLTVWAGAPKSGKSTIVRQLCKSVVRGENFLDRKCQKGKVLYLALEEQPELLAQQLRQLGVADKDDFYIHAGPVFSKDKREALEEAVLAVQPSLVVIDTLVLYAGIKDINNYNEVYSHMSDFRELARKGNTHIIFIHHQNKGNSLTGPSSNPSSIMGSSAIHGSVDTAVIFTNSNGSRFITSSQRGGSPFNNRSLEFDEEKQSYYLGRVDF